MMQDPDKYAWVKYIRDLLLRDLLLMIHLFKTAFVSNSDIEGSNKCRIQRKIKTVYKCKNIWIAT